jgi:hypothetical protein
MEFNLQNFLVNNKLTKRSTISEDDNTGGMLKTNAEQGEMSDEENFGDEEDTWYKDDSDDSTEFEKEPTVRDISKDKSIASKNDIFGKQAQLKQLEDEKDALVMQWKSGVLTTDQYRTAIGEIPTKIKNLRADIEKAMNVSIDDEEPEF